MELNQAFVNKTLICTVKEELEYYFSDINLNQDFYLTTILKTHGSVPLHVLRNFDRIRKLTLDTSIILAAISLSENLQFNADGSKVEWIKPDNIASFKKNLSRKLTKKTMITIKKEIEFQFSDYQLSKNYQLLRLIKTSSHGFVKLEMLKKNSRYMKMNKDIKLIAAALSNSKMLKVSKDRTEVKRVLSPFNPEKADNRTIVVKNLWKNTRVNKVIYMFKKFGEIKTVRFMNEKRHGKECEIEFAHPESVSKACEEFQNGTEIASSKGEESLKTTDSTQATASASVSTEAEEWMQESVAVQSITRSFVNLVTAEIDDLDDEIKENGKRSIPRTTEVPAKRIHLEAELSLIQQESEMDLQPTSGLVPAGNKYKINFIPMSVRKNMQKNKLQTTTNAKKQPEGEEIFKTTDSTQATASASVPTETEEWMQESDAVQSITRSFVNLVTAEIDDLDDEIKENGKRSIPRTNEVPAKRIHLEAELSLIQQESEMDLQPTSALVTVGKKYKINVLPMTVWKKLQKNKLQTITNAKKQPKKLNMKKLNR